VGFVPSVVLPGSVLRVPHLVRSRQFKYRMSGVAGTATFIPCCPLATPHPRRTPNVLPGHRKQTPGSWRPGAPASPLGPRAAILASRPLGAVRGVTREHRRPMSSHSMRGPGVAVKIRLTDHHARRRFRLPRPESWECNFPVLARVLELRMFSRLSGSWYEAWSTPREHDGSPVEFVTRSPTRLHY
jgi:hypothetical protein